MILYYCWGYDEYEEEYEYEVVVTWKDISNFFKHSYKMNDEQLKSAEWLYSNDYIDFDNLEEDDEFKDFMKDYYEDAAKEDKAEADEYANDIYGYYGVSRSDFFRG